MDVVTHDHARPSPQSNVPEVKAPEVKSGEPALADAFDEFRRTFEDFKAGNDRRLEEIQRKASADVVTVEKVDRIDLPLKFHPAAIRALGCFAPRGAEIATGDRRSWSGLRS